MITLRRLEHKNVEGIMRRGIVLAVSLWTLAGCTAVNVKSVDFAQHPLSRVCIQENPKVIVAGFLDTVRSGFARHGIVTEVYRSDAPPGHCEYTLTYVARQNWDMATYLWLANLELRKGAQIVGKGEYRLRKKGGLALNKWQSTESKMAPVIDQLLINFPKN
jgi:hypothetical protein